MNNFRLISWRKAPVGIITALAFLTFACTPEGVINKTKYQGQKITNTCESFTEEVEQIAGSNGNASKLVIAEYDNSDFATDYLEPGQFEIRDGNLVFRLAQDLEYEKYLTKGVAITINANYASMEHLAEMETPNDGEIGSLKIDADYYAANKDPYFFYSIPLENPEDLYGRQVSLSFSVAKYNKKGKLKKVFCNSFDEPIGMITPPCCTYEPWNSAEITSIITTPNVDINDEYYKYRGFTGTIDFIFPENSTKYDEELLTKAIQDYINTYTELGYQVDKIDIEGWASLGGTQELNQKLSERRANAVYEDLKEALNNESIEMAFAGKGEDWERLKLLTKASGLEEEERATVLSIANNMELTFEEKEAELRKLPFWEKLVEEVIVNTRHTFVTFDFSYKKDQMYVEDYPSQMPVISDELLNVANKKMTISKWEEGKNPKSNLRILDILIGNNKKANLYAMRSTYHFGTNNVLAAILDIDKALELNRNNAQYALASLAYKTTQADRYSLSERMSMLDTYNDYASQYPDKKNLFFNRAVMMDEVGYISGALVEYTELLEGSDAEAAQLNNRGVAKLKTMRIGEAETDFVEALNKNAQLAEAYFNLAAIYAYKGLTSKVIDHLDRAIVYNPELKKMIFTSPAFAVMKESSKFDKYR